MIRQQNSEFGVAAGLNAGAALERPVLSPHRTEDYYFTLLRAIAASASTKHRLSTVAKACSVRIVVLLVITALGPEKWARCLGPAFS